MLKTRTNETWLRELGADGKTQEAALLDLREMLSRAANYSFQRHQSDLGGLEQKEIDHLVEDCVQDALIAILQHLAEFRGDSKFTTWAYKFAINIALTRARHERWKNISLDDLLEGARPFEWNPVNQADSSDPVHSALQAEVLEAMRQVFQEELTSRQQEALALIVFTEVPLDEVVQRFGTNRNAVYKLLHDARRKFKNGLEARGLPSGEVQKLFSSGG